jgi:hypothetical protein
LKRLQKDSKVILKLIRFRKAVEELLMELLSKVVDG